MNDLIEENSNLKQNYDKLVSAKKVYFKNKKGRKRDNVETK